MLAKWKIKKQKDRKHTTAIKSETKTYYTFCSPICVSVRQKKLRFITGYSSIINKEEGNQCLLNNKIQMLRAKTWSRQKMQKYTKVTKWLQNESLITSLITCIVINLNDQSSQITFKVIAPQILYLQRKRCGGDYNYQASIFFSFFGELSL